ncbi:MAG TPA: 5'/3'-nucleotidase SurE [Flavobacteriales bacterium]|nr:5'/3'-nucleotidase SurE [Flavobacteriales bacterium]|tara:strand:+ start:70512 stop:71270 length:759 start_codon:yes stop_codon:yes gene_type:complete
MSKPLILVTNDDGITAPGIQALIQVAKEFGEVHVVAPDKPQSGMGHAITVSKTIHINETIVQGCKAVACSGTPVDCVKLAVNKLLPRKPDIVLSGINHGSNSSINVIYSGTMSAAVEGALENIPSAGFSLLNNSIDADFTASKKIVRQVVEKMLEEKLPDNTCLNVNIPDIEYDLINGIKICRQAVANWEEDFDERTDPAGNKYYWLTGKFVNYDKGTDTDEWALANNYVSIVPVQYDLTNYSAIEKLKSWE